MKDGKPSPALSFPSVFVFLLLFSSQDCETLIVLRILRSKGVEMLFCHLQFVEVDRIRLEASCSVVGGETITSMFYKKVEFESKLFGKCCESHWDFED